ncbi:histidine--tRNA ligase [Hyphomicrobium facile]|uniref:Histidine--tRNA ligase n=1 Tax=Hyphomicrobium facile TaxID=51670 RepID=A0A1I7NLC5_9HYPH|nr:histidine--tRNA ligase [Hyphomicrobium facile]SFV35455.1 histidyl-tRNA synthetase [Hyphomicrobium facile]
MSKVNTSTRPEARLAKGFRDIEAAELRGLNDMTGKIREVYERYGFEALETPAIEYTDALGKFLPDQDRPNAGVFSFQDEDEQWMSLRYDLTAPLARYVAQNFQFLPKPFRRYAFGNVYRNEKPGPGRFRQFMQFDADTVGAEGVAADAEMCMLAADTLEALGVKRGDYVIKVSSRKLLDGLLSAAGLDGEENAGRRLTVLRAVDKLDRLGIEGVSQLLGKGRKDESGDFTKGADLTPAQTMEVIGFLERPIASNTDNPAFKSGVEDLLKLKEICAAAGYDENRIRLDQTVVRGLEYYTGPVFEAELTFEVKDDDGRPVRFGSVGGGGRYDDLVARFTGEKVPATGFSIGVSRLQAALSLIGDKKAKALGPVVVLVMDKGEIATYQKMTQALRNAGVRAEMYLGSSGMKAQMKYADKRNSPCVIIQGSDERAKGEVTIKDLIEGAKAAAAIKDNKEWKEARPAQFSVSEANLIQEVHKLIKRHEA